MANSAHTTTMAAEKDQPGTVGRVRAKRATITFGADYAAAVLPSITAAELGLSEVTAVIPEGTALGTAIGCGVAVTKASDNTSFTLKLYNGTTAIGTVDESGTTVDLLILGH